MLFYIVQLLVLVFLYESALWENLIVFQSHLMFRQLFAKNVSDWTVPHLMSHSVDAVFESSVDAVLTAYTLQQCVLGSIPVFNVLCGSIEFVGCLLV